MEGGARMASSGVTVVVGGGCSGALVTVHQLERASGPVVLVDPAPEPGRGVAYRPDGNGFLLNSRACSMSAWPDRPGDFVTWCDRAGLAVDDDTFAPRAVFG